MSVGSRFLGASLLSFAVLLGACAPASTPQPTAAPKEAVKAAAPAKPAEAAAKPAADAPKPVAKIGGKLNVLGGPQPDWMQAQVRAFQEKTGIETEFVRKSGGEGLAQLKAEGNNPSFDVWWGTPIDSFISAQNDGLLETYIPPTAADLQPQHKDASGAWHGIYLGSIGWALNTRRLEEKKLPEPQTWDDLIKPEYRGEVVVAHPATSGTAYTTVQTILQIKGEDKGWEYLTNLHKNVLQYTKSGSAPMRMIEGSEAAIGIVFSHDIFVSVEKGLPIKLVFPQDGTGYEVGGMGIIKGAKNLPQAKAWVDWALTPEAQEIGPTVKAYQAPSNPKAKVSRPEFMQVKLINYDFQLAGKTEERVRTRFLEEIAPAPKD
jgi:iron(III) transport system substrate-binding protein